MHGTNDLSDSEKDYPFATAPGTSDVLAQVPDFPQFDNVAANTAGMPLEMLTDIPITITARLGETILTLGELLKMGPGAIVNLHRDAGQPVDLIVGGKLFARGQAVVVDNRFAVRITELANTRHDTKDVN
jgi:flagellar motor switch protein FliN/FliY